MKDLIRDLKNREVISFTSLKYGEPGYENEHCTILFGNWNKCTKEEMEKLENCDNYILEWDDEWVLDSNGDKAYKTEPDFCGWEKSYFINEFDEIVGILDNQEDYLNIHINNPKIALKSNFPIEKYGFKKLTNKYYESGLYGKEDEPKNIYNELKNNCKDIVFKIYTIDQFSITFEIYGK